ncbi:hypothetical protein DY000_02053966 [Brassica cretica]|uniref:Replication factor A C-terminal domain-containing protein n=1 Tax=Brassica cretica TaxID=69181 RepID=A0ABQ7AML9_BRACR|nr:hypothetical protein DY000_02053966 [Brassica cretica]
MVANGEESVVFVAFDTAITKLTNARATEVSNPIGYGEKTQQNITSLTSSKTLFGRATFHLKLTELTFLSSMSYLLSPESLTPIRETQGPPLHCIENCASCKYHVGDSFSKDTHLPEANDQTIGPASAVQEASNTYQVESNSENVDDPQGPPQRRPAKLSSHHGAE